LIVAAVLTAAIGSYTAALPAPARTGWLEQSAGQPSKADPTAVRGTIHIHTRRSDGTGTVSDVAAAAARAQLDFVVITDHGDGTRTPDPPAYYGDVLVIDAVELSTSGGHAVALGLAQTPYPLAGEPRDVVEDVRRLGGFAIAAHPGSAKPELRWGDWDVPLDGIEWLNADSEWRDEDGLSLLRALLTYPVRRSESVALILDRPEEVMRRWDSLTRTRRVVGVAAPDAHARIGLRSLGEPYDSRVVLKVPSYEAMFRTFSLVLPEVKLTRQARQDAAAVLEAIREGNLYSRVDALAQPGGVDFTARSGAHHARAGEVLPLDGPVTLRVETVAPTDARIVILKDGIAFRVADGTPLEETMPAEPAVYRVELRLAGAPGGPPVPWIVSNPIYVGRSIGAPAVPMAHLPAGAVELLYGDGEAATGKVERSGQSQAALDVVPKDSGGRQLLFRYAVGGRPSESPYAAIAFPAAHVAQFDRVTFTARADRPMRLAVQLRVPGGESGQRWRRSVYVDETAHPMTVHFDDLTKVSTGVRGAPPLNEVDSLLFVVDTVNTTLGGSGTVWLDDITFAR
jgi:hypothetical protein